MMEDKLTSLRSLKIDRSISWAEPRQRTISWGLILIMTVVVVASAAGAAYVVMRPRLAVKIATATAAAQSGAAGGQSLLDASGYVIARRAATISAKITGMLREVRVEEGQYVTEGEVIAKVDDVNYRAALEQVRAQMEQSEIAVRDLQPIYERAREQLKEGLIAEENFDAARSNFDQAQALVKVQRAAFAVAQRNEDDTIVRAPFSGVVIVKAAQPGEIVSPLSAGAGFTRTGISTIVDMDSLEIEVDVSEDFINRIRPSQSCIVRLNAYPDWEIPAEVIAAIPTADRSKATVRVRVALKLKDPRILPEMGARVSFFDNALDAADGSTKGGATDGVRIPPEAVATEGGHSVAYVLHGDHVERREISIGGHTAAGTLVTAGMSAGDKVAVSRVDKLADNMRVTVEQ